MTSLTYSELTSEDWYCYRCHTLNCDTFHAYEYAIPTSSSFSALMSDVCDDVSISPPVSLPPRAHSSPIGSLPTAVAHVPFYSSSIQSSNISTQDLPRKGDNWRTLVLNVNSVFGKAAALQHLLSYVKPDAVILTETKLNKDILTSEVFPSELGYTVYRKDRPNEGGGGVALLIRSCYSSTEVTLPDMCSGSEIIWVEIELRYHKKLLVSSFYRPPNDHTTAQLESLQLSTESVLSRYKSPNQSLIMGGDFNLPDIDWDNNCVRCTSSRRSLHDFFLSLVQDFSLFQTVRDATREMNILDLFLTNCPSSVKSTHVIPGLSDHEAVVTDCCFFPQHVKKAPRKVSLFSKADWDAIRAEMSEFSDEYFRSCEELPVDGKWATLKARLAQLVDKYVPSKTLSTRYRVPWLTNVMKRLSRKKKRLYTRASRSHGKLRKTLWSRYKTCKAEFNKGMKQAKEQFVNNIISSAFDDNDTKPFWKFVRAKRCDNNGIAPLKTDGCLYSDSQSKADILNRQFSSVFTRENTIDIPVLPGVSYPSMSDIVVEPYGEKLLSKVKPSKASGPDEIPCRVLKETAHEIAPILTDIFNCSLSTGILPRDWKSANVAQSSKKGTLILQRITGQYR